jgi:hypothetical protein
VQKEFLMERKQILRQKASKFAFAPKKIFQSTLFFPSACDEKTACNGGICFWCVTYQLIRGVSDI